MTNQQILSKAVKKAIKNGWTTPLGVTDKKILVKIGKLDPLSELVFDIYLAVEPNEYYYIGPFERIIFNHDFAKAIWPPKPGRVEKLHDRTTTHSDTTWQYHLQQMVISDDPVKYLGANI